MSDSCRLSDPERARLFPGDSELAQGDSTPWPLADAQAYEEERQRAEALAKLDLAACTANLASVFRSAIERAGLRLAHLVLTVVWLGALLRARPVLCQ